MSQGNYLNSFFTIILPQKYDNITSVLLLIVMSQAEIRSEILKALKKRAMTAYEISKEKRLNFKTVQVNLAYLQDIGEVDQGLFFTGLFTAGKKKLWHVVPKTKTGRMILEGSTIKPLSTLKTIPVRMIRNFKDPSRKRRSNLIESKLHNRLKTRLTKMLKRRYKLVKTKIVSLYEVPYRIGFTTYYPDLLMLFGKTENRTFKAEGGFWVEIETLRRYGFGSIKRVLRKFERLPDFLVPILVLHGRGFILVNLIDVIPDDLDIFLYNPQKNRFTEIKGGKEIIDYLESDKVR